MLAIVYGLEKFHQYTFAREVQVVTDHKPLVAISSKPLSKAPRRLQNLLMRAKNYAYTLNHQPGSKIPVADTLSWAPVDTASSEELVNSLTVFPVKDHLLERIRSATSRDPTLMMLGKVMLKGWPTHRNQIQPELLPYFHYRDEMAFYDGIIMRGNRVVIPSEMIGEMKRKVHVGNLGVNSTLRLARDAIFWPGMSSDIRQYI